jgi:DNA-binding MarR family transcriptional regulator
VQSVVDETIALYQWLAWVAEQLYGDDARGASRRWTLRRLLRDGPLTVPALARVRAVRRQSLQPLVEALVRDGLVELVDNPAHARSPLVQLTPRGAHLVERLDRIDGAVLRSVARGIPEDDLRTTASTLGTLRAAFATKMRWRPAATAAREQGS